MSSKNETVVTAMSGGVDSSVAAALLLQKGYNVIGVTMKLWEFQNVGVNSIQSSSCCSIDSMNDARSVCQTLGIPHYVIDFQKQFDKWVIDNFISEYLKGRTPNPCVICNTQIKWQALMNKANELNADFLSTGHYARITYYSDSNRYLLKKGLDKDKDQSYALWGLDQQSLKKTLFPLGEISKTEARQIAKELRLKTAEKNESQEICFVPDNNYRRLLKERNKNNNNGFFSEGDIVTTKGEKVGKHQGYPNFTIGQRKGVGVAMGTPYYVVDILPETNQVVIGDKNDLRCKGLVASQINWITFEKLEKSTHFFVKIRYRDKGSFGLVSNLNNGRIQVEFEEPQFAVTPGQSVVLYDDDMVVGGGIIENKL